MILNAFALIVLTLLIATCVAAVVFLGMLPGKIAKKRHHPQAEAVNVAGWVGILAGGVLWPFALVWAFILPAGEKGDFGPRIQKLEAEIARLKGEKT